MLKRDSLYWSFFVLPFFLFLGVAAQTAGLYLCAIALPFFVLFQQKKFDSKFPPQEARIFAICLLVLFAVFPAASFLNLLLPQGATIALVPRSFAPSVKKLFTSRFTTATLLSSLVLALFCLVHPRRKALQPTLQPQRPLSLVGHSQASQFHQSSAGALPHPSAERGLLPLFHKGVACAAALWCCYLFYQHVTGFDFRVPGHQLLDEHRLPSGGYRVFGLYGHPLSVAGVGLCFFVFYWVHFWQNIKAVKSFKDFKKRKNSGRFVDSWGFETCLFGATAALFLLVVYLSGGRTALGVAFVFLASIPLLTRLSGIFSKLKWVATAVLLAAGGSVFLSSGAAQRVQQHWNTQGHWSSVVRDLLGDRAVFWKIYSQMIVDKPFFGHGLAFIERGDRTRYYEELGHAALKDKYNAHNIYLEIVGNVGFVGAFVLVATLGVLLKTLWKDVVSVKNDAARQKLQVFFIALAAAIGANLLHAITQNVFFDANVTLCYLALFWVLFFACRHAESHLLGARIP